MDQQTFVLIELQPRADKERKTLSDANILLNKALETKEEIYITLSLELKHQKFHRKMKITKSSLVQKLVLLVHTWSKELVPLVQGGHLQFA